MPVLLETATIRAAPAIVEAISYVETLEDCSYRRSWEGLANKARKLVRSSGDRLFLQADIDVTRDKD